MRLSQLSVHEFIDELASDSPAPGGGSIAALAGSLSAALASMVANLTVGREKYKAHWDEIAKAQKASEELAHKFLQLMEDDTQSFNLFMEALHLPKNTEEEKKARKEAIQNATKAAIEVPLSTLENCAKLIQLIKEVALFGNSNAITDAGSSAALVRAGAEAAAFNVKINLKGIQDKDYAATISTRLQKASSMVSSGTTEIIAQVEKQLQ